MNIEDFLIGFALTSLVAIGLHIWRDTRQLSQKEGKNRDTFSVPQE
jgi:hypothetical protein